MDLSGLFNRDPHINPFHEALQQGLQSYQNNVKAAYAPLQTATDIEYKQALSRNPTLKYIGDILNNPSAAALLTSDQMKGMLGKATQIIQGQGSNSGSAGSTG